jgi:nucleoside-diphosphate-sugar epimerase
MAVYGASARRSEGAWAVVDDESPPLPTDVYGMSKHVCETLAADAARMWSIDTTVLRLGMFVPETFERYGFRLLFGGVDDRDHKPDGGFDTFNVFAPVPFSDAEAGELARDPVAVIERHWPGTAALLAQRHLDSTALVWGWAIWRSRRATDLLGWRPAYDFAAFLDAFRARDEHFYPFGDSPRWGV